MFPWFFVVFRGFWQRLVLVLLRAAKKRKTWEPFFFLHFWFRAVLVCIAQYRWLCAVSKGQAQVRHSDNTDGLVTAVNAPPCISLSSLSFCTGSLDFPLENCNHSPLELAVKVRRKDVVSLLLSQKLCEVRVLSSSRAHENILFRSPSFKLSFHF